MIHSFLFYSFLVENLILPSRCVETGILASRQTNLLMHIKLTSYLLFKFLLWFTRLSNPIQISNIGSNIGSKINWYFILLKLVLWTFGFLFPKLANLSFLTSSHSKLPKLVLVSWISWSKLPFWLETVEISKSVFHCPNTDFLVSTVSVKWVIFPIFRL